TTTLDNGVDLYGKDLKWIVIDDIRDFDTMIQCIGRKRFYEDDAADTVNVIIRNVNNNKLGGMLAKSARTLREVNTFIKDGTAAWLAVCDRYSNSDYCIYDSPQEGEKYGSMKNWNRAKYQKIKSDYHTWDDILTEDRAIKEIVDVSNGEKVESAFMRYTGELLEQNGYVMIDMWYKKQGLNNYLESMVGKIMLTPKDREELIERMDVRGQHRLLKSLNILNAYLEEGQYDYYIKEFETSRIIDGKKKNFRSAWKVMRLTDN
ncbi:hypothetical protein ACQKPA_32990, partial [Paenibacillus sp. NPDC093718]